MEPPFKTVLETRLRPPSFKTSVHTVNNTTSSDIPECPSWKERTILFVGDSIERYMMKAVFPRCPEEGGGVVSHMDCWDADSLLHVLYIFNKFDVSMEGPWHKIDRKSKFETFTEALRNLTLGLDVHEIWLGTNFWTLARLSNHNQTLLKSMDNGSTDVATAYAENLTKLMNTIQKLVPSNRQGYLQRFPARDTIKRGDYWWGNRVQQLNAAGTKAAVALGWRVYRTYDRKVDIRDSIHPTDAVLVETFQTLTGHRATDQASQAYLPGRRPKPGAPCDKVLANYSVTPCRSGPGQLTVAQDLCLQEHPYALRSFGYLCELALLGRVRPCVAFNLRSFDNVSIEVGLDILAPQCEVHTFHPCNDSDNTLGQRYNFTEHCITWSPSGFMSTMAAKRLGHKHVDAFMIDAQGQETVFLRHLQTTGFLQEIDQLQINFYSVDSMEVCLEMLIRTGFEVKYARCGVPCNSCTQVTLQLAAACNSSRKHDPSASRHDRLAETQTVL